MAKRIIYQFYDNSEGAVPSVPEKKIYHDKKGALVVTENGNTKTYTICDCLEKDCEGCHWPCDNCSSWFS